MSLKIHLYAKEDPEQYIMGMNWLRNPFGLCTWAEDNVAEFFPDVSTHWSLWYVVNHWNYDAAKNVNRPLFLGVVLEYWQAIQHLSTSYFFFTLANYRQFVEGKLHLFPLEENPFTETQFIQNACYTKDSRLMIPSDYFQHQQFHLGHVLLEDYQTWFAELVKFAELLQNPEYEFDCSN